MGERGEQLRLHRLHLTRHAVYRLLATVELAVLASFGLVQDDELPLVTLLRGSEHRSALTDDRRDLVSLPRE